MLAFVFGILLSGRASTPNDWLIVPGLSAGPITARSTHADLIRIFGLDNVIDEGPEDVGEGIFERVTVLNKNHPEMSATILWNDGKIENGIAQIRFCTYSEKGCRWHTREQISSGTSLKALEKLNGVPFTLAGFDWDYGGTVISFGGRLSALDQRCGRLVLRLALAGPKATERARRLEDQVQGDRKFSSGHAAMQALNPTVGDMIMDFSYCKN